MSTTTTLDTVSASPLEAAPAAPTRAVEPIPMTRLLTIELRKMFDTRAGFWLMASVLLASVLATAAVIIWAPEEAINLGTFSAAMGMPLAVVLPIIAILGVTSEYSQRSGLTTYTLVPKRGRVIASKLLVTIGVGVASMFLALAVGVLGNLLGAALLGIDPVWDLTVAHFANIVLAQVLGMLIGFTFGAVIRSSPGAVVGYLVYSAILPGALMTLAAYQDWFADIQGWVDVNFALNRLFDQTMTGEYWAQLGVTTLFWLWIPLLLGTRALLRAEVK